jgi:hypothetical protein
MSVRNANVSAETLTANQLSDRLKLVLEVGAKTKPKAKTPTPRPRATPPGPFRYVKLQNPALKLSRRPASPGRKATYLAPEPFKPDVDMTAEEEIERYEGYVNDGSIHGTTYVNALEMEDHVQKAFVEAHVADLAELIIDTKVGLGIMTCAGNGEEDARREEVLLAVESARKRLGMADWPLDATKTEKWEDFCAFEALVFFSNPKSLINSTLSISRAKLRRIFGQRELCGWVDTTLICSASPSISPKHASLLFLKACSQNHIDATNAKLGTHIPFCDSLTLSKMFVLVEELLLSSNVTMAFRRAKAKYEASSENPPAVCVEIERDGRLSYVWARMLYTLIDGKPMDGVDGDFYSKYPMFEPTASPIGAYLDAVFKEANASWWQKSLVLPITLDLVNSANYAMFQTSATWKVMTETFGIGSCLTVDEGETLFYQSKVSRSLKLMAAKTWVVAKAGAIAFGKGGFEALKAISRFAALSLPIVALATQMGLTAATVAPATTAGAAVIGGKVLMDKLREVNPEAANVVGNMTQTVTNEYLAPLAEAGVRTAAGTAADGAVTGFNAMATAGAQRLNIDPDYVPQVDPSSVATFVHNNAGTLSTMAAAERATGIFTWLGLSGVSMTFKKSAGLIGYTGNEFYKRVGRLCGGRRSGA